MRNDRAGRAWRPFFRPFRLLLPAAALLCLIPAGGCRSKPAAASGDLQKISAPELFAAFKADRAAAEQKYRWKNLEVSGTVVNMGTAITDQFYLILEGGPDDGGVQCYLQDALKEKGAQLRKGQKLTVRGKCTDYLINVILHDCSLAGNE